MRKALCSLLLFAVAAFAQKPAVVTTPVQAPPPTTTAPIQNDSENAKQAKALLDKMVRALGGDAYMTYQTREEVGRTFRFHHGQPSGTGVQFWRFWKYPDKDRIELTKQRDWYVVYNGDQAWETTFRGTTLLDKEELKEYLQRREYSNEYVLRRWLKAPGTALFYDGATIAESKPAEKVTIMDAQNRGVSYYMASDSFLPIKKTFTVRDPATAERTEETEVYDNYRLLQGIPSPLSWTWFRNGEMYRQRFLNTVTYNTPEPDARFVAGSVSHGRTKK
ncbi:MAG: hypothetical protein HYX28_05125 [Candidatus Koribacter versatilis]|uniref:Outer membrane lipoprotein-sorting protein n=1 Tax=Candidatus Korobacter versatilis TaxID=658062 RepID=A0A932A7Z4_9BACT|nr:hypothetical protein [Candidatus Koribacter versatilis]